MSELKNCPLCDGPAYFRPYKPNYFWQIGCKACDLIINFIGPDERDAALAKWNTRKHIPPVPEMAGTVPIVLYMANQQDADEVIAVIKEVKPNMEARKI